MRIFVAGASGAIGRPLLAALLEQGHTVLGMTSSETRARELEARGVEAVTANALDAGGVEAALRRCRAEVVIDQLTSLPKEQGEMPAYAAGDRRLRLEGGGNLLRAAVATGVRRYVQQSSGFFLKAPPGLLADESAALDVNASPGVAASARTYTELETRLFAAAGSGGSARMEGVALRYGFFYGPNTWYHPGESAGRAVMEQGMPIVGRGEGVSSFVHIDDAAIGTVLAIAAEPGVYNLVDDDPSPQSTWLPAFAAFLGAPPPPRVSEAEARARGGEDAVYYATKLSGAANGKARRVLGWRPRRLEWLGG